MFVICLLACFIIHGDSALGQEEEMDSPINDSTGPVIAEALQIEDIYQHGKDNQVINITEGRAKQRLVKGKIKLLFKALMFFKLFLFIVSVPLSAITAKILSWNAMALSFLAFVASKLVLVRSLFHGPSGISQTPAIVIQSSSDPVRRFRGGSKIYIQPDPHIPDVDDEAQRRKRW